MRAIICLFATGLMDRVANSLTQYSLAEATLYRGQTTGEDDVRLVFIRSRAWYIPLSSPVLLVAAKAPTQLGILADVTTGPQRPLVSVRSG